MNMRLSEIQLIVFILGSSGLVILSRHSFGRLTSHGFPRFFAFEAILGLLVLNAPFWISNSFSIWQVISWIMLLLSIILAISAFVTLQHAGKPDSSIRDPDLVSFEKTTHLVTTGPYQVIRHPMYASLVYFALGVYLKQASLLTTLLLVIACLTLFLTAVYEERESLRKFGDEYATYFSRTKRFFPFIF